MSASSGVKELAVGRLRTEKGVGVNSDGDEAIEEGVVVAEFGVMTSARFSVEVGVVVNVVTGRTTRTVGCWYASVSLLRGKAAEPDGAGTVRSVGVFSIESSPLFWSNEQPLFW